MQLADEIVRGTFAPGEPLDEIGLATRYGVSRTPVREALRQLAASGLVEIRPHRGAIVTRPSETRLLEMFVVMAELEGLCAGLAAEAMSILERRDLDRLHGQLGELVATGDPTRYALANERFHGAIYAGSHNAYLAEMTLATRARLAPFRRAQFRQSGRLAESFEEHARIVRAILAGDRAGATREMRDHIGTVKEAFDRYIEGR
ncbi:MAG: GntR family transcriptional regulator [Rhizobiales bacterium]|nr:GntR family transcriptional regulator [Hyphomicrobiales bacterium]